MGFTVVNFRFDTVGLLIFRLFGCLITNPNFLKVFYVKTKNKYGKSKHFITLSGRVKETFCPVLYKVAVHHVATFVFLYADQPPSKRFRKMIDALGNQVS